MARITRFFRGVPGRGFDSAVMAPIIPDLNKVRDGSMMGRHKVSLCESSMLLSHFSCLSAI